MADKPAPGFADTISDWWNKGPEAPVPYTINGVPVVNQPVDRRTFDRNAPAPYLSASEAVANVVKNTRPLDFTRDTLKGLYKAGEAVVTDPVGTYKSAVKFGDMLAGIYDARTKEQTGKWPEKEGMSPSQLAKWRQEAEANYRKLASHYSYVDKDGVRRPDSAALMRNLTQHPMETMSILTPFPEFAGAKMAASAFAPISAAGKVIEGVSKAGNIATNIAPYAIAQSVKAVSPAVSAGLRAAGVKPTVFTRSGDYSPKMQQAFKAAGVDPKLFDSPEMRKVVQDVINDKGISPAAIREATLRSTGVSPSRSMTTGEVPLSDKERGFRSQAGQNLSQNMADNVEAAYKQATSHRGVFTNTSDFSAGVRKSIEDELAALDTPLTLADVQGNVRFSEARKALQGEKGLPGVFKQFDDLAGVQKASAAPQPKPLTTNFGGTNYTFDYGKNHWSDPSGTPITNKPYLSNALDTISNRKNIPPPEAPAAPTQGPNRLTPQGIDSVRRNVSYRYSKADGDDQAVLAAINRGIDNYTVQNAPNFTGDGAAMAADWANARKTSQLASQYGRPAAADPFAAPRPPVAYDPSAVGRTEAARAIVQNAPDLRNTTPPTAFNRVMGYLPSVGTGQVLGYNLGAATGLPGAGFVAGSLVGAGTKAIRNKLDDVSAGRIAESEAAGAPRTPLFQAPDVRNPATVAGGIATAAQSNYQTPVAAPPAPPAPAAMPADRGEIKLPEVKQEYARDVTMPSGQLTPEKYDLSGFGPSQGELKPEVYDLSQFDPPQRMYGGRAGYRAGGKVNGIEPLVLALMNKAKMAKKTSNKATEPLLNERDDAIANALAVAQKAI